MKITKLKYCDYEYDWTLNEFQLLPDLNLIVGVSGAGKTKIIQAITNLQKIANGASFNGVEWGISFSTQDNVLYHWYGKFETKKLLSTIIENSENKEDKQDKFRLLEECLFKENADRNVENIINRSQEGIIFKGETTIKLSRFESVLKLLSEEEDILLVKKELDLINRFSNQIGEYSAINLLRSLSKTEYDNPSLETIQTSNLPTDIKLHLTARHHPSIFQSIKNGFLEIFTTIEDLKIDYLNNSDDEMPFGIAVGTFLKKIPIIYIKEKGVENWIRENQISSGMLKSLMYISEQYLSPKGSVILIDQFEDSLGVNCIDSITDILTNQDNDLQFIITSHHPYVINNISPKCWKIVTRQGGVVTVKDAEEYHISSSRQKAFIDLINILGDDSEGLDN
jgi:predicted ATPase